MIKVTDKMLYAAIKAYVSNKGGLAPSIKDALEAALTVADDIDVESKGEEVPRDSFSGGAYWTVPNYAMSATIIPGYHVCGSFTPDIKPKPKVYKLSEMWKVWMEDIHTGEIVCGNVYLKTREQAIHYADKWGANDYYILAITRGDATEFYEAEGLDEKS